MSRPKFAYYRSVAHLRNVASLPCQCCGAHGTQAAHSNESRMGKGRAIKASDEFTAALCPRCHSLADASYSMTRAQREQMWQNAHEKTRAALMLQGLWPFPCPACGNETYASSGVTGSGLEYTVRKCIDCDWQSDPE